MERLQNRQSLVDLSYMGLALALVIIGAKLSVPIGPVPISLQNFFVLLSALFLGAKRAFIVQVVYLGIGLLGLPVFAKGGGPAYVLLPSFGYLIGFALAAPVCALLFDFLRGRFDSPSSVRAIGACALAASLAGVLLIYAVGVPYMIAVSRLFLGSKKELAYFLQIGLWPFLPIDFLKAGVVALSACALKPFLNLRARPAQSVPER